MNKETIITILFVLVSMNMDWMQEQDEPACQNEDVQVFYKGRTPSAKLGLKITK